MNFHRCGIQRVSFCVQQPFFCKSEVNLFQHTCFGPAGKTHVDGVPVTEFFWEVAPRASVFATVNERVNHEAVVDFDIASLLGEEFFYFLVLVFC